MTVNPGFGVQAFLPEMLEKIAALRQRCNESGLHSHIEVDGGQSGDVARRCIAAGADVIAADREVAIRALRGG